MGIQSESDPAIFPIFGKIEIVVSLERLDQIKLSDRYSEAAGKTFQIPVAECFECLKPIFGGREGKVKGKGELGGEVLKKLENMWVLKWIR